MAGGNIVDEITNVPYGIAIGEGLITGRTLFSGFSSRNNISINSNGNDIWTGEASVLTIPPSGGEQMAVTSTSASDTVAGSGVNSVLIDYLDASGTEGTEEVFLNGVTPVSLSETNVRFVQCFHTNTAGIT